MLIVLADAELELIPDLMRADEEILCLKSEKGDLDILLDNALMKKSIQKHFPKETERMGFPHIAYLFARMNEESLINDTYPLDYSIHTKHNLIIERGDISGIGAGYTEFKARVEELLVKKEKRMALSDYLESRDILANTVVLHPKGRRDVITNDQLNFIIGGFPEGDFKSNLGNLRKLSIHDREVTVPGALELLHFRLFQSIKHP